MCCGRRTGMCRDEDWCPALAEDLEGNVILRGWDDVEPWPLATHPAGEHEIRVPWDTLVNLVEEAKRRGRFGPGGLTAGATRSVFRLETLQRYTVPGEVDGLRTFIETGKLPPPEPSPWLERIRTSTAAGCRWRRVHVVRRPPTDYIRFELLAYQESVEAGYETLIADSEHPELAELAQDFYLLDDEVAVLMRYDDEGRPLGARRTSDPATVQRCRRHRDIAESVAGPLEAYLELVGLSRQRAVI